MFLDGRMGVRGEWCIYCRCSSCNRIEMPVVLFLMDCTFKSFAIKMMNSSFLRLGIEYVLSSMVRKGVVDQNASSQTVSEKDIYEFAARMIERYEKISLYSTFYARIYTHTGAHTHTT